MNIVICGSMSAARVMIDIEHELEKRGHTATLPSNIDSHIHSHDSIEQAQEKIEFDVFRYYFEEINKGDAILVINPPKNGRENYVGPNTLIEMAFAHVLNKKIYILNKKPKGDFSHEIEAMKPIELSGVIDSL